MAEQNQPESQSLPRVGIVQSIEDVRGNQTIPASLRNPTRDAFLALHRSILRISSSIELSVSSKASSQDTLNEPSAVARWSERFEEAFHSETSLATNAIKVSEREAIREGQDANKTDEVLSNIKSNPCSPLIISPNCASITSASCGSITSGSITGFEFPAVNRDRATLDQSITSNGRDTTLSAMQMEHQVSVDNRGNDNHVCCASNGGASDKNRNSTVKCVCIMFALLSVVLIPFLISHLLYNYGRSKQSIGSRRRYQIVSIVYCLLTYLLLFTVCTFVIVLLSCDCIGEPW